jgi:Uma2 family endonuclease
VATLIYPTSSIEEQRVLLPGITWQQYESLLTTLGNYPGLRLIYLDGTLEIFMSSLEHEMIKKIIARLLERYAEEVDKLAIYQGLEVPEVLIWRNNQLRLYDLRGATYQESTNSQFFPDLDFELLAQYIRPKEQPQAIKAFLQAIRVQEV